MSCLSRRHVAPLTLGAWIAWGGVLVACGVPTAVDRDVAQTAGRAEGDVQGETGAASSAQAPPPGLEAALASLEGPAGRVPAGVLATLRDSSDPAEQRAYRLLAVRGDAAGMAGPAGFPATRAAAETQDADEADGPSAPVALVVSDAAAAEERDAGGTGGAAPITPPAGEGTTGAGTPSDASDAEAASAAGSDADDPAASATADAAIAGEPETTAKKKPTTPSKPKPVAGLTMITRIALHERGNDVELDIVAAGPLAVGSARGESEIRVVVEDAGALPAALQARPSAGEVRVTDVRRGDETVQIAVELPSGWKVASKRSTSSGARVRFAAR